MTVLEDQVSELLRLLTDQGAYEANEECINPVCQLMAQIATMIEEANNLPAIVARTNGHSN